MADRSDRRRARPITPLTAKVAVQRLALGARMPMMARSHARSTNRPDIRLHPMLDHRHRSHFFTDVREESIYAWLARLVACSPRSTSSPGKGRDHRTQQLIH